MLHVIWNPHAGKGRAYKIVEKLKRQFPDAQFWKSTHREAIQPILEEISSLSPTLIMIVGGDGTINSLAYHTELLTCPVVPVPVGSGNGIAHQLGIRTLEDSIRAVKEGSLCKWHLIETNQDIKGFNILGSGFTGFVAHKFATTHRGLSGYVKAFFKTITFPEHEYEVNGVVERAWDVSFVRGREWGNSVVIHPEANGCSDDAFAVSLRKPSLFAIPYHFFLLLAKHHQKSQLWQAVKTNRLVLTAGSEFGHIDGEPVKLSFPLIAWKSTKFVLFKKL
ncbi:MAG: hypothetical protein GXO48_04745 [Chlorobi bacterium]|nr:hypothetical protein [Chlorobiota bacterium]